MEARHFWFRSRNRLIIWTLRKHFAGARSFLEIGCGTGFVLTEVRRSFPALAVSGSDAFTEGLGFAATRLPGVPLFQMDATRIPFDAEFDAMGAFDVLEHIEDDRAALRAMRRAIREGGGVIVTVPQHPALWGPLDDYSCHRRRYTRRELVGKLTEAGFEILRVSSFVSLLLPLLLLSRWRQRRGRAAFDPHAEYRLASPVNAALGWVLAAERLGIAAGLSLPAGGSLLAVARRR
jgi:SAM-dependent methyltransferase